MMRRLIRLGAPVAAQPFGLSRNLRDPGWGFVLRPLIQIIFGHLAAGHLGRIDGRLRQPIFGALALGSGILLCTVRTIGAVSIPMDVATRAIAWTPGRSGCPAETIGAVLVSAGLAFLPVPQRQLEGPSLRWLGKTSLSLFCTCRTFR